MTSVDVAVLGGGPAGLAAAWWAARRGLSVTVLEAGADVGGLAASFEVGGVRVDHGSHRLHRAIDPEVLAELRSLLGDDLQPRQRSGRVRVEGRWVSFPLRLPELLVRLPPRTVAALGRDALMAPLRRGGGDTFAGDVRRRLGPTLLDRFYGPYARKLWGRAPEELSAEQSRRRIPAASALAVARKAIRPDGSAGRFWYPRRGFGQIAEALATAATEAGAQIRTAAPVTAVGPGPDAVSVTTGSDTVEAGAVLSTIPISTLARVASDEPEVTAAAGRLSSRAMTLVYLVLDGRPWTPFDAHYLPGPETPVSRVSEPANYRDGDDPPDRTVLCAELPCDPDDATWSSADFDLVARVAHDLGRLGLPAPHPVDGLVRRVRHVYPVYDRATAGAMEVLDRWSHRVPRVLPLGRQGLFAHDNTHHTLLTAKAAVEVLGADLRIDRPAWDAHRRVFATHVVED